MRWIERFSGLALLARFSGVNTYEALDAPPVPHGVGWHGSAEQTRVLRNHNPAGPGGNRVSPQAPSAEVWLRCAVYLDRLLPDPRLGGLAAELAP